MQSENVCEAWASLLNASELYFVSRVVKGIDWP